MIDTATEKVRATVHVGNSPHSLTVSPDGAEIATANDGDNTISIISAASDAVIQTFPAGPTPQSLTYSADGRHLYVGKRGRERGEHPRCPHRPGCLDRSRRRQPQVCPRHSRWTRLLVSSNDAGQLTFLRAASYR